MNTTDNQFSFAARAIRGRFLITAIAITALVVVIANTGETVAASEPESRSFYLSASSNYQDFSQWFWPGNDFSTNLTLACSSRVDEVKQEVTLAWSVTQLQSITNQQQFLLIATQDGWPAKPYPASGLGVTVDTNSVALVDIRAPVGQRLYYQVELDGNDYQLSQEVVGTGAWKSYVIPFAEFAPWGGHPLCSFTSFCFRVVLANWQLDYSLRHSEGTIQLRNVGVGNWLSIGSISVQASNAQVTLKNLSIGNAYEIQRADDLVGGMWTGVQSFVATNRDFSLAQPISKGSNAVFFRLAAKGRYPDFPQFLIGVGSTDPEGCVPYSVLTNFLADGLNYFLPFTSWAAIQVTTNSYTGTPCPGDDFIGFAKTHGATLNGQCVLFLFNAPYVTPSFAYGHPFSEQKQMIEGFIRATVARYPSISMWTLNEPVAQNVFNWSREQVYEVFVSASQWIHEVNPAAKVLVNMIPMRCNWSGLDYEPNGVLDDLMARGLQADVIGIELYSFFAGGSDLDVNGYPTMDWVKSRIDVFRRYGLPILFSEAAVPGEVAGRNQFVEQADWLEGFFRLAKSDPDVVGAVWYFVRDDNFMVSPGLLNHDYSMRPAAERLISLARQWKP